MKMKFFACLALLLMCCSMGAQYIRCKECSELPDSANAVYPALTGEYCKEQWMTPENAENSFGLFAVYCSESVTTMPNMLHIPCDGSSLYTVWGNDEFMCIDGVWAKQVRQCYLYGSDCPDFIYEPPCATCKAPTDEIQIGRLQQLVADTARALRRNRLVTNASWQAVVHRISDICYGGRGGNSDGQSSLCAFHQYQDALAHVSKVYGPNSDVPIVPSGDWYNILQP